MLRRTLVVFGSLSLLLASLATGASAEDRADAGLVEVPGAIEVVSRYEAPAYVVDNQKLVPIVVKLDEQPVASYDGSLEGYPATSPAVLGTDKLDPDSSAVVSYRDYLANKHAVFAAEVARIEPLVEVTRSYEVAFGGVAMLAPLGSIGKIAEMPGVVAVYEDRLEQPDTDRSPAFIGVGKLWRQLGGQSVAGEGIIVAAIDTGVWPEHASFSDPDPNGNAYPEPDWNGSGTGDGCDFGDTEGNPDDAAFECNNKLIGAYDFTDTYKDVVGLIEGEFDSARDAEGHGTHVISTAAGNGKVEATMLGVPYGMVSGIAPRAHVVMYKGCGLEGCFNSDTLAGVEQAILDGVDVLNFSISGGENPYGDVVSLGFFDAYNAGILVTPSAGNEGPGPDTVGHREPWTLTVGATTTDRSFSGEMTLTAGGASLTVEGATITDGIDTPTEVVFAPDEGSLCIDLERGTFDGEIVLCERGDIARVAKSFNVKRAGGSGMILLNPGLQGTNLDLHFIPSLHLEVDQADLVRDFMAENSGVTGTLSGSSPAPAQGDTMADFSSRGGPGQTLGISKPDVVAPGVNILAGHTPVPVGEAAGLEGQLFQIIGGTSMAAPHAAGSAALLMAGHPDWVPGQVKSALMMTAYRGGVTDTDGVTPTTPFDVGSGRILPSAAATAPLTISDLGMDYENMADHLWDANYPSLYVPALDGTVTVERTVHNELDEWTDWIARPVDVPDDLVVSVRKQKFALGPNFGPYANRTLQITVDARDVPDGEIRHAGIQFRSGAHQLYFPITIVKRDAGVVVSKTCEPDAFRVLRDTAECSVTVENTMLEYAEVTITDRVPRNLRIINGSVEGGTRLSSKKVTSTVMLNPIEPPDVDVAVDNFASPAGYLGLGNFGGSIDAGATDESITNFSVPAFEYGGELYDTIGVVSNGYVVVGGGDGADVNYINSDLPDEMQPNNVLAPFWTDLNPDAGGRVIVNLLGDGSNTWIVVEWEAVPNWGDGEPNTAQIWIGLASDADPGEDISFTYASVSDGDSGWLTVGAENFAGSEGGTTYFDGVGVPPAPSFGGGSAACDANWPGEPCYEVDVFSTPGAAGGVHTLSFLVRGTTVGTFENWAVVEGDGVIGKALAGYSGEVIPDQVLP